MAEGFAVIIYCDPLLCIYCAHLIIYYLIIYCEHLLCTSTANIYCECQL